MGHSENNFRFLFVFITSAFLMFGCASHDVQNTATLETLPENNAERIESQGFELIAKAILSEEEHISYFDNDLIKQGILPLQLYIGNVDSDDIYQIKPEDIVITDANGVRKPALTVDQIVQKTKKSYWRTAGWTVLFGVFGAVPSAINVSKTNAKIRASYNAKILKESSLRRGNETEGLMFFVIPKESTSIDNWELSMVLNGNTSANTVPLKYQLRGEIPERKSADSSATQQQTS